jgi:hypothetical protein
MSVLQSKGLAEIMYDQRRSWRVFRLIVHESKQATSKRDAQKNDAGSIGPLRNCIQSKNCFISTGT